MSGSVPNPAWNGQREEPPHILPQRFDIKWSSVPNQFPCCGDVNDQPAQKHFLFQSDGRGHEVNFRSENAGKLRICVNDIPEFAMLLFENEQIGR